VRNSDVDVEYRERERDKETENMTGKQDVEYRKRGEE